MEYFRSNCEEKLIQEQADITLLTWNILGLPNELVAIRSWEKRIDPIAEKILSIDADVVVLQECFEEPLSLGLRDRLAKTYAHIYLHLKENSTPLPSGLALFSKLPVANMRFLPHPNLLDTEKNSKMGIMEFVLLNASHFPVAHFAASHFQGSSNCEWRFGVTEEGNRLSYAEVREQQAKRLLHLFSPDAIPHYVCGDLNVDRRSLEYHFSSLNEKNNPSVLDPMSSTLKTSATNTNFWKHEKGLAQLYPKLAQNKTIALALRYQELYEKKLKKALSQRPWNQMLSEFDLSFFDLLEQEIALTSEDQIIWKYFKIASERAILEEKKRWERNQNEGTGPFVSIGRAIEIRALPIEESLDYILGIHPFAIIRKIEILKGYDHTSIEHTLSDHHPVWAQLHVAQAP